jgi:hypothetical protein
MFITKNASINNRLTREYRELILRAPLYDTGALYSSAEVELEMDLKGRITVKIYALFYIKYHEERTGVTDSFVNSSVFNDVIGEVVSEWIEYHIDNSNFELPGEPEIEIYYMEED